MVTSAGKSVGKYPVDCSDNRTNDGGEKRNLMFPGKTGNLLHFCSNQDNKRIV